MGVLPTLGGFVVSGLIGSGAVTAGFGSFVVTELGVDVEALRAEVQAQIDAATEEALAGPMPAPETATERVFYDGDEDLLLADGAAPYSAFAEASG